MPEFDFKGNKIYIDIFYYNFAIDAITFKKKNHLFYSFVFPK